MQQDKRSEKDARRFPPPKIDPLDYIGEQLERLVLAVETLNANLDYIGNILDANRRGLNPRRLAESTYPLR